ncbi:MAG TPA: formate dehydrogenase accessory sulfurtransferase FdhD [Thermoanaerobaculia bacterium]|nr:formate dehydrogenase accessory sulfurtransferase FdhD [Thermoanaerobaculia bacterium]
MRDELATRVPVTRYDGSAGSTELDWVSIEEPLEIRIGEKPLSVTMRTPGEDFALAAGFLLGESVVTDRLAIESIRHWGSPNVVRVDLREGERIDFQRLQRHFYSTSSCGVCGKTSIEALRVHAKPVESRLQLSAATLASLPAAMRERQESFASTGGLHAAALFDAGGTLLSIHEDVGRHNAVDKVIGSAFLDSQWPLDERLLFVSGRVSFEILQKAIVARIGVVAAISAPSSLAIDLARDFNVTLAGFVRGERFNLYTGAERLSFRP